MPWAFGTKESSQLLQALRNPDSLICCQAAQEARKQRLRSAVPALVELLYRSGPQNAKVRAEAARALGEIGDVRAVQHLGEAEYWEPYPEGAVTLAAIEAATNSILSDPKNRDYLDQLATIRMHRIKDFFHTSDIYIDPDIQQRRQYPFTVQCAKRLLSHFKGESFAFQGHVRSLRIYDGKEVLPRHSYANVWLYSETIDEIQRRGAWPDKSIGTISFEFEEMMMVPYVAVTPEPNWPHPSIVRRCYKDISGGGIRFEER